MRLLTIGAMQQQGNLTRIEPLPVITGLVCRFSAQSIDADPIDTLIDSSGNGYNAAKIGANVASLILNVYNGQKTIRFTVDANYLNGFPEIAQPNTIICVVKQDAVADSVARYVYGGTDVGFRHIAYQSAAGVWQFGAGLFPAAPTAPARWFSPDLHLNYCEFNGAGSKFYANNDLRYEQDWGTNPIKGLTVGSRFSNETYSRADICELIVYNRLLTEAERNELSNYLMNLYGL